MIFFPWKNCEKRGLRMGKNEEMYPNKAIFSK